MVRGNVGKNAVRGGWLAVLLMAAAAATGLVGGIRERYVSEQAAAEPKPTASVSPTPPAFGQQQIWRLSRAAMTDLHKCTDPTHVDCVRRVMERRGASAGAFDFYRRTGWFLSKLKDTGGPVMLASVVNPWRANENEQPALLGGNPSVLYPEEVQVPLEDDAVFKALKADFPNVMFWKSGPTLETSTVASEGERFVFRYRLLDGCHACSIRGWARIEFDFAPDGTSQGAKLLNVTRQGK